MTDRNVQFPNRFEIVPVPGTTNIFDVNPAPGTVYENGTFWNKQNVLKDATAALYGKGPAAVPDEIFAAIFAKFSPLLADSVVVGNYRGTGEAANITPTDETVVTNSTSWQNIIVGFKPKGALLMPRTGDIYSHANISGGSFNQLGGIFSVGNPIKNTVKGVDLIGAEITSTGFRVRNIVGTYKTASYYYTYRTTCNSDSLDYQWIAFK